MWYDPARLAVILYLLHDSVEITPQPFARVPDIKGFENQSEGTKQPNLAFRIISG
jgi:hypothetical protein